MIQGGEAGYCWLTAKPARATRPLRSARITRPWLLAGPQPSAAVVAHPRPRRGSLPPSPAPPYTAASATSRSNLDKQGRRVLTWSRRREALEKPASLAVLTYQDRPTGRERTASSCRVQPSQSSEPGRPASQCSKNSGGEGLMS